MAAATPTSAPVIPPECANVASITPIPAALTPTEAPLARKRFEPPVCLDVLGDPRDPALESRAERARRTRETAPQRRSSATSSRVERSSLQAVAVRRRPRRRATGRGR